MEKNKKGNWDQKNTQKEPKKGKSEQLTKKELKGVAAGEEPSTTEWSEIKPSNKLK